jgi:hypothetical protein
MHRSKELIPRDLGAQSSSGFENVRDAGSLELVPENPVGAERSLPSSLSEELLQAWSADARCVECGEEVSSPADAAFLVVSRRVTHARECFLPALLRGYPTLTRLSARARAMEVIREPDDEAAEGAEDSGRTC